MLEHFNTQLPDSDPEETNEWLESIESVLKTDGPERAAYLVRELLHRAKRLNIGLPPLTATPYINTIPPEAEPDFPGDEQMEKRIRRIIRWNAVAMVHRANQRFDGLGGHLSTYASSASLYEVGFNHFFRGQEAGGGDQVYVQGHAAPGIYARAFLEGRLTESHLEHFRRETSGKGLPSYPHPYSMPEFWQFPTVSMGLGPISAIYQARFNRYLHARGIKDTSEQRVWAYLGDGETDEPEALGALSLAARERLDNLTFVVNCNLQRLDGPVRGNGKIIQELERVFRGAGWHVIKVVWGPEWNELLDKDTHGHLVQRMTEVPDGQFQKYSVETGEYIRKDFFGKHPALLKMVEHLSDDDLVRLRRGGHSYRKIYAAYQAATEHKGSPVVILAKTIKGWTLGSGFAGSNVTHSLKKMKEEQLRKFRDMLQLPIADTRLAEAPFYHPGPDSPEVKYMLERRQELGGALPIRTPKKPSFSAPRREEFKEFFAGAKGRTEVSTTMAFVRILRSLVRNKAFGKRVVPIVPDEARTFGMDPLFREIGIYSSQGQTYEPVDAAMFLNYHESKDGQLIEEGITEAGSMATFTAAGTSYATHGEMTIPFYVFYSMFGLQRTADQIWALSDCRGRGFLMGATAGRTTLNGEGLQHQDGHSLLFANAFPTMMAYDPTFAYELAVVVQEGLRRMIDADEDIFYYITLYNENYAMPAMPAQKNIEEQILSGLYLLKTPPKGKKAKLQLFGSGPMLQEAIKAQKLLAKKFNIHANVWSVTSYQQLYRNAREVERHNRLHPESKEQAPYIAQMLKGHDGPIVASSDWVAELPNLLKGFIDNPLVSLGTNGFGMSDTREALRQHFEIDANWIAYSALYALMRRAEVTKDVVSDALQTLGIDPNKHAPD